MNSLEFVVAVFLAVVGVSEGLPRSKILKEFKESPNYPVTNRRSSPTTIPTSVDSLASASGLGWAPQGYKGPLAVPEVRPDGTIADTPEVESARAAHLAALESARLSDPDMDDGFYDPKKYGDHHHGVDPRKQEDLTNNILFFGELAKKAHKDAELAAQAAAEAESLALWQAKNAVASGDPVYGSASDLNSPYFGPFAVPQVLPSGFLADTAEVAAAREKHLSVLAEVQAMAALWKEKQAVHKNHWN